jgi:hypothetical protein
MCIPRDDIDDTSGDGGGASDPRVGNTRSNADCHDDVIPLPGSIPNVTIAEFGSIEAGNIHAIQAEIYARYEGCLLYFEHVVNNVAATHGRLFLSLRSNSSLNRGPVKTSINA